MACVRTGTCPQFRLKSSLKVWQTYYCEGDFSRCERFKLASCNQRVPLNLLPNGKELPVPLEQIEAHHLV